MSRTPVERVLAAHASRDTAALGRCYSADATVWPTGWPQPVPAGDWVNAVPMFLDSFPDLHLEPLRIVQDGSVSMAELRMTGTNLGPLHLNDTDRRLLGTTAESLPPSGRAISIDGVAVFVLRGDLVATERHFWLYEDSLTQLGHLDPAPAKVAAS